MADESDPLDAHLKLAKSLVLYAKDCPWRETHEPPMGPDWWWGWWNRAFARAGARMLKAVVVLTENGLGKEADLPLRALVELVGNQHYMRVDKRRAAQFAVEGLASHKRFIERLERWGVAEPESAARIRGGIADDEKRLADRGVDLNTIPLKSAAPFGQSAKSRIMSAGLEWQYDLVFATTSDLLHMNARAVALYAVDKETDEQIMRGGALTMASRMILPLLYVIDEALKQGQSDVIDGYARQYWKLALPNYPWERFLADVRPPASPYAEPK